MKFSQQNRSAGSTSAGAQKVRASRSVAGKNVLITGGARGIGAATAVELVRRGARVSLVGLEPDLLERNVKELGEGHMWVEADVTDQAALDAAVTATVEQLGGIDIVIANAGIANFGTVRTCDPEAFNRTIAVNLVGVYRTIAATVPHLADSRGYALIVASVASFVPLPGGAAYAASKAGVESLAASLRIELAQYGVTVGSIHPSWIDTDLVRGSEAALPTFAKMREEMPWPANSTTSVEDCAIAFADAVERRALRTYVPKSGGFVSAIRPLALSGLAQRAIAKRVGKDLRQLDTENQALGATWR
jgi:NAD(P)-dependent dehydrogenase (short-subunit alcohol dehydrogenase family)